MAEVPGIRQAPATTNPMVQMEALRRRAGLGASSAGISAEATNAPTAGNPMPRDLQTNPAQPSMGGGANGNPSDGAVGALKEQKSEAQHLGNALIFRLKKLTERGE